MSDEQTQQIKLDPPVALLTQLSMERLSDIGVSGQVMERKVQASAAQIQQALDAAKKPPEPATAKKAPRKRVAAKKASK